jgi:hypothetical protein
MKRTDGLAKPVFGFTVIFAFCLVLLAAGPKEKWPGPQYDGEGNLLRPADYRDWEFLSAGYGMNYSPAPGGHEMFTNVFVQRWSYEEFLKSGKWPEHSMFVIDERDAESKGSINKKGHFQTDLMGLAVEVKDSTEIPTNGPTTALNRMPRQPRPCRRATSAGPATTDTPQLNTRSCSSIPR